MKNTDRIVLIKESLYYVLGIVLIVGFVYLYWGHFTDAQGPPSAIRYIMNNWGRKAAMEINAAVFLLFILFLPFRDRIEWRSKGMLSAFILALFTEMFGVPLLIFLYNLLALITKFGVRCILLLFIFNNIIGLNFKMLKRYLKMNNRFNPA